MAPQPGVRRGRDTQRVRSSVPPPPSRTTQIPGKKLTSIPCPGCNISLTPAEFAPHTAGCARIHGFNASSRHANVKVVLASVLLDGGIPYERTEPREWKSIVCPGCREKLPATDPKAANLHIQQCATTTTEQKAAGADRARKTGPDGAATMGGKRHVYDVTVSSTTAPSFKPKEGIARRIAEKEKLYGEQIAAQGDVFVVFAASAFGSLDTTAVKFMKQICSTHDRLERYEAFARVATAITLSTGKVIREAERLAGVIHRVTAPAPTARGHDPPPSSSTAAPTASTTVAAGKTTSTTSGHPAATTGATQTGAARP